MLGHLPFNTTILFPHCNNTVFSQFRLHAASITALAQKIYFLTKDKHLIGCISDISEAREEADWMEDGLKGQHRHELLPGLHKLWYPGIRDRSTWGKFGAHGEHGDVFLFSNLGALWFSENLIRYSLHVCLREVKNNLFSFKHSYLRHFSWRF